MDFVNKTLEEFAAEAYSKSAVPGGGGVSSYVGALGCALAGMVSNLTRGKKKYAAYEEDIEKIAEKSKVLYEEFLFLVDEDARVFLPLSKAYALPRETDEEKEARDRVMQGALREAIKPALRMMEMCLEGFSLHEELLEKGNSLAISDVGVGSALLTGALKGAYLNVLINTLSFKDRKYAEEINEKALLLLCSGEKQGDYIYKAVSEKLGK